MRTTYLDSLCMYFRRRCLVHRPSPNLCKSTSCNSRAMQRTPALPKYRFRQAERRLSHWTHQLTSEWLLVLNLRIAGLSLRLGTDLARRLPSCCRLAQGSELLAKRAVHRLQSNSVEASSWDMDPISVTGLRRSSQARGLRRCASCFQVTGCPWGQVLAQASLKVRLC